MMYRLIHETAYDYMAPVEQSRGALHLLPVTRPGQRVIAATLALDPLPRRRDDLFDYFGNRLSHVEFDRPHRRLSLTLSAAVEVSRAPPPPVSPAWEAVRRQAHLTADLSPESPAHFLYDSPLVPLDRMVGAYAAACFPPGRPIAEAALALAARIKAEFAYDPAATDVATPLAAAFAGRRGVCQDFAQVMICGLRTLGLPARYVSGYLRTLPPPGQQRLTGADATHAWVDVWCGEEIGWIGLDPTNAVAAGNDHVVLALGRDYADVAPVTGVVLSSANHLLSVRVNMEAVSRVGAPA